MARQGNRPDKLPFQRLRTVEHPSLYRLLKSEEARGRVFIQCGNAIMQSMQEDLKETGLETISVTSLARHEEGAPWAKRLLNHAFARGPSRQLRPEGNFWARLHDPSYPRLGACPRATAHSCVLPHPV